MKHFIISLFSVAILLCCTMANNLEAQCPTYHKLYVDINSTGSADGSSWANAYKQLRAALAVAATCPAIDSILVAAGTYYPATVNSGNRDTSFVLPDSLKLYGGYPTGGGVRNVAANPTLLSGDIGVAGDSTDNSYHVVIVAGLTADSLVVDGFTISGGRATGGGSKTYNGIAVNRSYGGSVAVFNNSGVGGKIVFRNCTFSGNSSSSSGGGMFNSSSSPTLTNCTFFANNSSLYGGGMYNIASSPTLTNCTFSANSTSYYGGGVYNANSSYILTNCTFSSNSSSYGGGIDNVNSSPTLTNCIFWGNTAPTGPGIYNENNSSNPRITYSLVQGGYVGTGNLSINPLFVNAADPDGPDNRLGTADDGLLLQYGSSAINAGNNDSIPAGITTDLADGPRIINTKVNMGAYEGSVYDYHRLYVDLSNTGSVNPNGSSWANPLRQVRQALQIAADATNVDSVLVAANTYYPTAVNSGNRDTSFTLFRGGLKLYGGYPTGGGVRNVVAYPTILSGDIGVVNDSTDNSYHVMVIAGLATDSLVLDGFTIRGGRANGDSTKTYNGFVVDRNRGGGITVLSDGSIGSKIALRNCIFSGNSSAYTGGGMRNYSSSPTLTNCTFSGNSSNYEGGGMFNFASSSPTLTNCTFSGNSSNYGGGMENGVSSSPTLINCTFSANNSSYGGGMGNVRSSSPILTNCTFSANNSSYEGGGMFNFVYSSPTLTNCIFSTNNSSRFGGGISNDSSSSPILTNCTISSNSSSISGGGINNYVSSSPILSNCILWGNTAPTDPGINNYETSSNAKITYSLVQGGYTGAGNLNADPLFVNVTDPNGPDNRFGTADDGLRLLSGSPAINTGRNDSLPTGITTDIIDSIRIQGGIVDMGAYEGGQCPTYRKLYVDSSSTIASSNGATWGSAFRQLSQSLSVAAGCPLTDSILIAKGTYKPTADGNRDSAFTLFRGGLKLYGGYPAGGGVRNIAANPTILSGNIGNPDSVKDNSYHVVVIAWPPGQMDSLIIDGFTITGGNADGTTIRIYNNIPFSAARGGGINLREINASSSSRKIALRNTAITKNKSSYSAGGIYIEHCSPVITNCIFSDDSSSIGGGIFNYAAFPSFAECTFVNNNGSYSGGGIYSNNASRFSINNCNFLNNSAEHYGGGIFNDDSYLVGVNCTFAGNNGAYSGSSIYNFNTSYSIITNSIFWGNIGPFPFLNDNTVNNSTTVTYSLVQGGYTGAGNLNTDPLFVNATNPAGPDNRFGTTDDGLHLLGGSPAINAGINDSIPTGITTDITGAPRIQSSIVDMGAYEGVLCPTYRKLYVDSSSTIASSNGSAWGSAFQQLSQTLSVAAACPLTDSILIAKGTYKPTANASRDSAFTLLRGGLKLYGGYPTGGGVRNVAANSTILSGDIGVAGTITDNSYHVVMIAGLPAIADSLVLDGFTISGGNANGSGSKTYSGVVVEQNKGGAMVVKNSSPTAMDTKIAIRNCTLSAAGSTLHLSGVKVAAGTSVIKNE